MIKALIVLAAAAVAVLPAAAASCVFAAGLVALCVAAVFLGSR